MINDDDDDTALDETQYMLLPQVANNSTAVFTPSPQRSENVVASIVSAVSLRRHNRNLFQSSMENLGAAAEVRSRPQRALGKAPDEKPSVRFEKPEASVSASPDVAEQVFVTPRYRARFHDLTMDLSQQILASPDMLAVKDLHLLDDSTGDLPRRGNDVTFAVPANSATAARSPELKRQTYFVSKQQQEKRQQLQVPTSPVTCQQNNHHRNLFQQSEEGENSKFHQPRPMTVPQKMKQRNLDSTFDGSRQVRPTLELEVGYGGGSRVNDETMDKTQHIVASPELETKYGGNCRLNDATFDRTRQLLASPDLEIKYGGDGRPSDETMDKTRPVLASPELAAKYGSTEPQPAQVKPPLDFTFDDFAKPKCKMQMMSTPLQHPQQTTKTTTKLSATAGFVPQFRVPKSSALLRGNLFPPSLGNGHSKEMNVRGTARGGSVTFQVLGNTEDGKSNNGGGGSGADVNTTFVTSKNVSKKGERAVVLLLLLLLQNGGTLFCFIIFLQG